MKLKSKIFYLYIAFAVLYIVIRFIPESNNALMERYHLSRAASTAFNFTLIIPTLAAWFGAFYGYEKLRSYGKLIKRNKDGKHIGQIANGLLALAIGLPLNSILTSIFRLVTQHSHGFIATSTIITNYIGVIYAIAAFAYISVGAHGLTDLAKVRLPLRIVNAVALVSTILGVMFCTLIANSRDSLTVGYHLSYSWVILTVAIPYIYIWFIGLLAVAEIYLYSQRVAGIVYRKSWRNMAFGLASVVLFLIAYQYLTALSRWIITLHLPQLLLLLYVLLLLMAGAFIVMALGAKRLMKIEEA